MHAIKTLKNKTITLLLIVALTVTMLFGAVSFTLMSAKADTVDDIEEFAPSSLGLGNTQFDSSSGNYPASPNSWTGASLDGGKGKVISGVIDLTANSYFGTDTGNKAYKLDQYPEYADEKNMPQTIFGGGDYPGTDAKTLMVNTAENVEAAYGYTSGDMSFAANAFYRVSVWVKTSNFASDTGATIKLTGLGQNCSFLNINTVKNLTELNKDNNFGWVQYTFYVRSSAALTKTVNLVLGVGDGGNADDELPDIATRPAHGYAFFDTVEAERITAHDFAKETEELTKADGKDNVYTDRSGTVLALDMYELDSLTVDDKEIGTFSQNTEMWVSNVAYDENDKEPSFTGTAHNFVYNSESIIPDLESDANVNGFTQNPWSPLGRAEYNSVNNESGMFDGVNIANIMLISTYYKGEFGLAAYGIASPSVKIDRFKYYRFGVWVKGDGIDGGDGISILVKGKPATAQSYKLLNAYSGLEGDSSDTEHYGWKEQVIYIKGSMLADYDIRFELWLGSPTSMSKGIAMFDNVTFTELKYSDYTEMSAADGGEVYSIDGDDMDTGITNGSFSAVGDFDEIEFPLPVADWTYVTPDSVLANGFSTAEVNTDHAKHGIIPTDDETISSLGIAGLKNPNNMVTVDYQTLYNVLLLSSRTPTAFGYQSSSITLSSGSAYKLNVDMAVDCKNGGYGASLVLKTTDGDIISTIENITDTNNAFVTYTFYVAAPLTDQTVFVEIWLGLNDRYDNTRKLSSGNVYVSNVELETWSAADDSSTVESEFAELLDKYKTAILTDTGVKALKFGIYSFSAPTLDYYDIYSYGEDNSLGKLYQWSMSSANSSVKSGMFNSDNLKGITVYEGFSKKDLNGNMLYIFNTENNRTTYTYGNTLTLAANMYYRIDIDVKVKVTDEIRNDSTSIGANLKLVGPNVEFSNIKDTTTLGAQNNEESRDRETFKRYTFYIASGDEGGDIGLEISFGGSDRTSYIQGGLVIGGITMTEIDNIEYESAEKDDTDDDRILTVKLSESTTSDDDENTEATSSEIQWWIIPTVIFSAALIAVIVIIIVVRVRDRIKEKRKKNVTYSTEYGRADALRDIERLRAEQDKAEAEGRPMEIEPENIEDVPDDTSETEVETKADESTDDATDKTEQAGTPDDGETAEQAEQSNEPTEPAKKESAPADDLDD